MADVPLNQRLWNSLVIQARAKFNKWPSLPASKWVHQQYKMKGGRFADSKEITAAKQRAKHAEKKSDK